MGRLSCDPDDKLIVSDEGIECPECHQSDALCVQLDAVASYPVIGFNRETGEAITNPSAVCYGTFDAYIYECERCRIVLDGPDFCPTDSGGEAE